MVPAWRRAALEKGDCEPHALNRPMPEVDSLCPLRSRTLSGASVDQWWLSPISPIFTIRKSP